MRVEKKRFKLFKVQKCKTVTEMVLHSDLELKFLFGNIGDEQKGQTWILQKILLIKCPKICKNCMCKVCFTYYYLILKIQAQKILFLNEIIDYSSLWQCTK